jgi:cytoskeletal protein RodZ
MVTFEETSDQSRSVSPHGPVFVDASGKRLRRVKLMGLGALGLVTGYVILLLVALIGGSNVAAPFLPLPAGPAAHELPQPPSAAANPAPGLQASEARWAEPAARTEVQGPANPVQAPVSQSAAAPAQQVNSAAMQPAAPAAPVATPAPSATAPGKSSTAPGQTTRPSAPPHP